MCVYSCTVMAHTLLVLRHFASYSCTGCITGVALCLCTATLLCCCRRVVFTLFVCPVFLCAGAFMAARDVALLFTHTLLVDGNFHRTSAVTVYFRTSVLGCATRSHFSIAPPLLLVVFTPRFRLCISPCILLTVLTLCMLDACYVVVRLLRRTLAVS